MDANEMLKISWEWEPAPGVRLPEHEATWARIEIRAGGEVVTLLEDSESGSSRRSIYAPLYPLAEWLAFNWWKLLFNSRLSRPELINAFERTRLTDPELLRNNFRRIGDGFSWPDLAIIPAGNQTTVSWRPYTSPVANWKIRYIGRGDVAVASADIQGEFARIINAVISRLDERGITSTVLHKEWAAVTGADAEEADYCRTAARLGLDPYSEAHEFEDEIIRSSQILATGLFTDFIDAVSPTRIRQSQKWVSQAEAKIEEIATPWDSRAQQIRAALSGVKILSNSRPWEAGWEQARLAREAAEVDCVQQFNVGNYVATQDLISPEPRIQALGRRDGRGAALVIGSRQSSSRTRNFLEGRAFWHSVANSGDSFLVTDAYTEKQKVERAFAAELLAPAAGISQLLDGDPWSVSLENVERIADHFDVSAVLVQHQIDNQLVSA
ncbi:ImmA/IrrE family metallo-endopeptidase [Streptomyces cyaneofuscatus]|uniref:ImmA/IrrE family metallo-endopeptidase n=1 Tax=Streptomyces cyaneofuscatus TaxID=66883 RepID=UPI0036DAE65E